MGHQSAAALPTRLANAGSGEPIHGLVIEDNDALREILCKVLAALGIEAQGVDRERGVNELLARQAVHLVANEPGAGAGSRGRPPRLRMAPGNGLVLLTTRDTKGRSAAPTGSETLTPLKRRVLESLVGDLRRNLSPDADAGGTPDVWTYDAARWKLMAPNGCAVQLSLAESQVIRCLFERRGEVAGRDQLLTALNRPHLEAYSRNLDVTVSRLRKKVESLCQQKLPLTSARCRGYAFYAPVEIVG